MVTGDNKGHKYEKQIADILKKKKIPMPQGPAGSGGGTDMTILYNKKKITFEMKNNTRDPDYGQCVIKPKLVGKKWIWEWSKDAKKKKPEVIKFYDNWKCIDGTVGVLEYIKKKNLIPNKHRVENSNITKRMKIEDQHNFEDTKNKVPVEAFGLFYKKKSDYVQIGKGYGFFHINKDTAGLGTEKFDAEFTLRLRAKSYDDHYPICSKCKIRYKSRTKICKKCENYLKSDKKEICKDCGKDDVQYKEFEHVYFDYGFMVVLKCTKIKNKSKFNIEEKWGQEFPPIISKS